MSGMMMGRPWAQQKRFLSTKELPSSAFKYVMLSFTFLYCNWVPFAFLAFSLLWGFLAQLPFKTCLFQWIKILNHIGCYCALILRIWNTHAQCISATQPDTCLSNQQALKNVCFVPSREQIQFFLSFLYLMRGVLILTKALFSFNNWK